MFDNAIFVVTFSDLVGSLALLAILTSFVIVGIIGWIHETYNNWKRKRYSYKHIR
jgi:hypothetical protein